MICRVAIRTKEAVDLPPRAATTTAKITGSLDAAQFGDCRPGTADRDKIPFSQLSIWQLPSGGCKRAETVSGAASRPHETLRDSAAAAEAISLTMPHHNSPKLEKPTTHRVLSVPAPSARHSRTAAPAGSPHQPFKQSAQSKSAPAPGLLQRAMRILSGFRARSRRNGTASQCGSPIPPASHRQQRARAPIRDAGASILVTTSRLPSVATELLRVPGRFQRWMLGGNQFGSFLIRPRAFVHAHDLAPVANVGARAAAARACRLGTGAGGKPEQAYGNDNNTHRAHHTASDDITMTSRRMKPPTSTNAAAVVRLCAPSQSRRQ